MLAMAFLSYLNISSSKIKSEASILMMILKKKETENQRERERGRELDAKSLQDGKLHFKSPSSPTRARGTARKHGRPWSLIWLAVDDNPFRLLAIEGKQASNHDYGRRRLRWRWRWHEMKWNEMMGRDFGNYYWIEREISLSNLIILRASERERKAAFDEIESENEKELMWLVNRRCRT